MSIRNQRTRRHEDDLHFAATSHDGWVGLKELLEHLEETVVEVPEAYGDNVCAPLGALLDNIREVATHNPELVDIDNAEVHIPEWDTSTT